jgi:peptidoglycan/xylan/chitin deacetylase (PgdA/CDA1 family)
MLRRKVVSVTSRLFADGGLLRALDQVNSRRGGVILCFHEISAELLDAHLSDLAETYNFISLDEIVERIRSGKSTIGLAAITFDDGFRDVVENSAVLAKDHGWPMTFYLPTRFIDTGEPCWFMELDVLLNKAPKRTLQFDGQSFSLNGRSATAKASEALKHYFKQLSTVEEVERSMRTIRMALFGSEARPKTLPIPEPISWERVKALAKYDELSFEAHTVNHLAMSRLSEQDCIREMEGSRNRIEEVTGRPVRHFCYPYGGRGEVGASAPAIVGKLFRSGTTTNRGRCYRRSDLTLLPRVLIDGQDSPAVGAFKVAAAR